jgi:hypothetical protein
VHPSVCFDEQIRLTAQLTYETLTYMYVPFKDANGLYNYISDWEANA